MGKRGLWGAEPGSRCCSLVANPGSRFWAASRSRVSCSELLPPSPAASPSPWLQSHILGSKCVISPSSTRPQLMPSLAAPLLPSTPLIPLDLHQILLIFPSENGHSSFFASWPLCPSIPLGLFPKPSICAECHESHPWEQDLPWVVQARDRSVGFPPTVQSRALGAASLLPPGLLWVRVGQNLSAGTGMM